MKREHLTVLLRTLLWFSNSKDKEVDGGEAVRQRDVIDERALVEWMEINGSPTSCGESWRFHTSAPVQFCCGLASVLLTWVNYYY